MNYGQAKRQHEKENATAKKKRWKNTHSMNCNEREIIKLAKRQSEREIKMKSKNK